MYIFAPLFILFFFPFLSSISSFPLLPFLLLLIFIYSSLCNCEFFLKFDYAHGLHYDRGIKKTITFEILNILMFLLLRGACTIFSTLFTVLVCNMPRFKFILLSLSLFNCNDIVFPICVRESY